jgi:hypothetical protein
MFSPSAIIGQLTQYLPELTNMFNQQAAVSAVVSGNSPQLLTITLANHGFSTGAWVVLTNSLVNNPIIGVSQHFAADGVTNILRFQTQAPHDLICNNNLFPPDADPVTMIGFADPGLDSTLTTIDVSDRYHFDVVYPTMPTLTGSETLQLPISTGLNGPWQITVIDINTFSITLNNAMYIQPGNVPQLNVNWGFNISGTPDWKTAMSLYTPQSPPKNNWIFVIMGDCRAGKDPNILSDAKQTNTSVTEQRIKMINTFSLTVLLPTNQSFSGAEAEELCWNEILFNLIQVMSGVNFPTTLNSDYITTLISHGIVAYNTAYYAHNFEFEYVYEVANIDTWSDNFQESIALRQINMSLLAPLDTGSTINLDTGV